MNVFINIAIPFVAYTVLAYMKYLGAFIITMFVIATIISVAYVLMTKKYSQTPACRKQKCFNFKRFSFLGVRTIVTSCTTLIVVYLIATSVTGLQLFRPATEEAAKPMVYHIDRGRTANLTVYKYEVPDASVAYSGSTGEKDDESHIPEYIQ